MSHRELDAACRMPPPEKGYVYIIGAPKEGLVKIGKAMHPPSRIADIQRMSPVKLVLHELFHGYTEVERRLHVMMAAHRRHGEWFDRKGVLPLLEQAAMRRAQGYRCVGCEPDVNETTLLATAWLAERSGAAIPVLGHGDITYLVARRADATWRIVDFDPAMASSSSQLMETGRAIVDLGAATAMLWASAYWLLGGRDAWRAMRDVRPQVDGRWHHNATNTLPYEWNLPRPWDEEFRLRDVMTVASAAFAQLMSGDYAVARLCGYGYGCGMDLNAALSSPCRCRQAAA